MVNIRFFIVDVKKVHMIKMYLSSSFLQWLF